MSYAPQTLLDARASSWRTPTCHLSLTLPPTCKNPLI